MPDADEGCSAIHTNSSLASILRRALWLGRRSGRRVINLILLAAAGDRHHGSPYPCSSRTGTWIVHSVPVSLPLSACNLCCTNLAAEHYHNGHGSRHDSTERHPFMRSQESHTTLGLTQMKTRSPMSVIGRLHQTQLGRFLHPPTNTKPAPVPARPSSSPSRRSEPDFTAFPAHDRLMADTRTPYSRHRRNTSTVDDTPRELGDGVSGVAHLLLVPRPAHAGHQRG